MAQPRQMQASLCKQIVVQLLQMLIHFREFHACICRQDRLDRQSPLNHEQQHSGAVLTAGQGYRMEQLLFFRLIAHTHSVSFHLGM